MFNFGDCWWGFSTTTGLDVSDSGISVDDIQNTTSKSEDDMQLEELISNRFPKIVDGKRQKLHHSLGATSSSSVFQSSRISVQQKNTFTNSATISSETQTVNASGACKPLVFNSRATTDHTDSSKSSLATSTTTGLDVSDTGISVDDIQNTTSKSEDNMINNNAGLKKSSLNVPISKLVSRETLAHYLPLCRGVFYHQDYGLFIIEDQKHSFCDNRQVIIHVAEPKQQK